MTASTATVVGVLDRLHRAGIRFDTRHGRLVVTAPAGVVDDDLLAELDDHRDLLVWAVAGSRPVRLPNGRTVRHRWAPCDMCGEAVLTAVGDGCTPRRCRLTPGCKGRYSQPTTNPEGAP